MTQYWTGRALAVLLTFAVLVACAEKEQPAGQPPQPAPTPGGGCPADSGKALTLVVGARNGSPRPVLPSEVTALIDSAARHNQRVQVVRVDGQPNVALGVDTKTDANNSVQVNKKVEAAVKQVTDYVGQQLTPKQAEADVLSALGEAGRATPSGGTVVMVDSGVSTAGSLSFRDNGMFGVDPDEEAGYLAGKHLLPKLDGLAVLLVGLGGTAEPQPVLDENLRDRVLKLWQAVAAKAGATCTREIRVATQREPVKTAVPVTVVPLPVDPPFRECGPTVLADSDSVGFVRDTADLRDPAAADRTLQRLVTQVMGGTQHITLVGNTANVGSQDGQKDLSRRRAETVKAALVRQGVPADRVSTRGDGSTGSYHEQDHDGNGALVPAAAARNRSVVVELDCGTG